jgi:hypothetical protein
MIVSVCMHTVYVSLCPFLSTNMASFLGTQYEQHASGDLHISVLFNCHQYQQVANIVMWSQTFEWYTYTVYVASAFLGRETYNINTL